MGCLVGVAGRPFGYLLPNHDNIETLERQTKKLAGIGGRVQAQNEAAERNLEMIETHVHKWMSEVEAENFL